MRTYHRGGGIAAPALMLALATGAGTDAAVIPVHKSLLLRVS